MDEYPYPILTHSFIDYMETQNVQDKTLLEIGSGYSTLYWEEKFKKVISYENYFDFYNEISSLIKRSSTEMCFYDKNILEDKNFLNHVKSADYIIIDNDPNFISRYEFSVFCKNNIKQDASIILDNGLWHLDAYNYLANNFFTKDFPGKNKLSEITVTTIFNTLREQKYFDYTIHYDYDLTQH